MDKNDETTVEMSLKALSQALCKAEEDLCAVRGAIDLACQNMSSHNGSHSRVIVRDAERAVENLRKTEESLRDVVKDLSETE
jgi:cob(I)alamin adenosyltransferase